MKKVILSACVMFITIAAYGQRDKGTVTLQPKVGLNMATITNDNDADSRFAPVVGAEIEVQATDMVSFSGGLLYSMQGAKGDAEEKGVKASATIKNDYLNIPILANVYVAPGLALKAGLQPGFKVSSKVTAKAGGFSVTENLDDAFKSFDLSVPVGISYEYMNVCLDARYNIGVTKVMDGADSKNSVFQVTLGYKFAL